jgi:CRISPR-associated protein Cmr2
MIFSIGPVQDFINTARRSRDLWYGSWMLSELSKTAAKKIVELTSFDNVVFPHPSHKELLQPASDFNAPNKIVAVVETDDPKKFAEKIEETVRDYLTDTLAKTTLDAIKSKTFNRTLADAQIKDLPEFYWVSVPYNNRTYDVVRDEAEALLVARKATRDFNQMTGENRNVPKSSLDGSRESVINENEYPKNNASDKEDKIRELYEKYHARQGERLSGVDLLKRLGARRDEPDFKSTSHMAAIPFMDKLGKAKTAKLIKDIQNVFTSKNWNIGEKGEGALLYESRLTDWIPAGKDRDEIREAFNKKWKDSELGESRPSPYYALLRADGDNMGKVIDAQKDEGKHRELSKALSGFAAKVTFIVNNEKQENRDPKKDNKGLLIYSGGDDVLAYLPINTVLRCASELEEEFSNSLAGFSATEKVEGKDIPIKPTLSVGIVIAHHLDPLSDVLQLARDAEHKAKDEVAGKNGLAITLSKRSGIDRTIVGRFSELYERVSELKKLFDAKLISAGTAYELQELQRVLSGTGIPKEGIIKEALRIVKHKKESGGGDLSDKVKDTFKAWIETISLDELTNEMIIAKALADGAEPDMVKQEAQK